MLTIFGKCLAELARIAESVEVVGFIRHVAPRGVLPGTVSQISHLNCAHCRASIGMIYGAGSYRDDISRYIDNRGVGGDSYFSALALENFGVVHRIGDSHLAVLAQSQGNQPFAAQVP